MSDILSRRIPITADQVNMLAGLVDEKIGTLIAAAVTTGAGSRALDPDPPVLQLAPWYALRTALAKAQQEAA